MLHYKCESYIDKFLLILAVVLSVLTGIYNSLFIAAFGQVVNVVITYVGKAGNFSVEEEKEEAQEAMMQGVTIFVGEVCGLAALSFSFGYLAMVLFNRTALKQIHGIRLLYLEKLLNQDISWYDTNQTTDFASRMITDLKKVEDGLGDKIFTLIYLIANPIACFVIALITAWELSLICMVPLVLTAVLMGIIKRVVAKMTKDEVNAYADANSVAEEVFTSIKTVLAFDGQQQEQSRHDKFLTEAKDNNLKRVLLLTVSSVVTMFVIYSTWALCFWYGVKLIVKGHAAQSEDNGGYTPSQLILVFMSVSRIINSLGSLPSYVDIFSQAQGAAGKIFKVINNTPSINICKGKGRSLEQLKGSITFKNVSFSYPSRPDVTVLEGMNLKVQAGQTVALIGSSGCGKSSCIQLIQRFYDPTAGAILIDEIDLKDFDLNWLREQIGVVDQTPVLFEATIAENIKLGCQNATMEDIRNAAEKAYAHTFISKFPQGYDTLVGERGVQLSGGQKQRIAIARALIRKPSVLLLDEATSALDANSEALVQTTMDLANMKCTTIIVAHRLSTIRQADRILFLADGKILEDGTHEELMQANRMYYHLVNSQAKLEELTDHNLGFSSQKDIAHDVPNTIKANMEHFDNDEMREQQPNKSSCLCFIMKMCYPETFHVLLGCLASLSSGLLTSLYGIIFGGIIKAFISNDVDILKSDVEKFSLGIFILAIFKALVTGLQLYLFSYTGEMLNMRLRSRIFASMLNQEVGWFDLKENGVGSLCAQISRETVNLQGTLGTALSLILNGSSILFFSCLVAFCFEWRLALIFMAFLPLYIISFYCNRRIVQRGSREDSDSIKRSSKVANEAVSNVRTVNSLCCEKTFYKLYKSELLPTYKVAKSNVHIQAVINGIVRTSFFTMVAPMYYGAVLIKDKGISLSAVFTCIELMTTGLWYVGYSLTFLPEFHKALMTINNIFKLLNRVPNMQSNLESYSKEWEKGNIKYDKVQFTYPTRPLTQVLKGIDLSIFQGKTVALVGPSGCGKSTIVNLLMRFYDPNQGRITVDDELIKTMNVKCLRRHLGVVSQEPNLFNRTIAENIAYGDNAKEVSIKEIIEAAKRANIHSFISSLPLGYETGLGEKGIQLSGGQKQRIAIARALIRNPKVLLLDEATSALDANNEKMVQEALNDAKKGRSCVVIAHRLSTIRDADVICAINNGKIIEKGTHHELMKKKGFYYNLYNLHLEH